jgi:hypothetical protein
MGTVCLTAQIHAYVPSDPLFSRSWALQELLLSPRILVFDKPDRFFQAYDLKPYYSLRSLD